jgi:5-methylcytosine-specific restriction endonuclease McrA
MNRITALGFLAVAAFAPDRTGAQTSINWHTALPKESVESIAFRNCRISARDSCNWTFQDRRWTIFFPTERIAARKVDGYYKQINFENLRCVSPGLKPTRCHIVSMPFDREHLLLIDPQSGDEGQQTWRIAAPIAVRYDR